MNTLQEEKAMVVMYVLRHASVIVRQGIEICAHVLWLQKQNKKRLIIIATMNVDHVNLEANAIAFKQLLTLNVV